MTADSGNTICAGIIKDSHPPAVLDVGPSCDGPFINYPSASDDCSTGTPGPIVDDTEIFLR